MALKVIFCIMLIYLWEPYPIHPAIPKQRLSIGFNNLYLSYTEPNIMKETGTLVGLNGTHTIAWPNNISIATQLHVYNGDITYDGTTNDNTPYKVHDINNTVIAIEGHAQRKLYYFNTSLTFYLGLGYRYWLDKLGSDPLGYNRKTTYLYIPIGLILNYPVTETLSLNILSQYNLFIEGKNTITSSNFPQKNHNINVKQSTGHGYLLGCNANLKLSQKNSLSASIQYQYWDIESSNVKYIHTTNSIPIGYLEPKNNTKELRLGMQYTHLFSPPKKTPPLTYSL